MGIIFQMLCLLLLLSFYWLYLFVLHVKLFFSYSLFNRATACPAV